MKPHTRKVTKKERSKGQFPLFGITVFCASRYYGRTTIFALALRTFPVNRALHFRLGKVEHASPLSRIVYSTVNFPFATYWKYAHVASKDAQENLTRPPSASFPVSIVESCRATAQYRRTRGWDRSQLSMSYRSGNRSPGVCGPRHLVSIFLIVSVQRG